MLRVSLCVCIHHKAKGELSVFARRWTQTRNVRKTVPKWCRTHRTRPISSLRVYKKKKNLWAKNADMYSLQWSASKNILGVRASLKVWQRMMMMLAKRTTCRRWNERWLNTNWLFARKSGCRGGEKGGERRGFSMHNWLVMLFIWMGFCLICNHVQRRATWSVRLVCGIFCCWFRTYRRSAMLILSVICIFDLFHLNRFHVIFIWKLKYHLVRKLFQTYLHLASCVRCMYMCVWSINIYLKCDTKQSSCYMPDVVVVWPDIDNGSLFSLMLFSV